MIIRSGLPSRNGRARELARSLRGTVRKGSVCVFALSATALSSVLAAQEATSAAEPASPTETQNPVDEVRITGSRILQPGMTSPTPVTSMTAEDLQVLSPGTLMDAMDQMPQFMNNITAESGGSWTGSGGPTGQSVLNLRGLGVARTLVLLDGRRIVSTTRLGGTDVNLLPQALIQRTEVVTGGASAAYGSDAVSGVVNFILDTGYTGLQADIEGGITSRSDNESRKLSLAAGTAVGERGHVIMSAEYYRAHGIIGYEGRDWYNGWGQLIVSGSGPDRVTVPDVRSRRATYGGLILDGPLAGTQFLPGGVPAPFLDGTVVDSSRRSQSGGSGDLPGQYSTLIPEQDRYSAFAHFKYDLTDNAEWFVQGMLGNSLTRRGKGGNTIEPGANPGVMRIFRDNAFLPDSIRQQMIDQDIESFAFGLNLVRNLSDTPARKAEWIQPGNDTRNKMFSVSTGLDGQLAGNWHYNAYYQYGRNDQDLDHHGNLRVDRIGRAIDSVIDPETGEAVCLATLTNPNAFDNDQCVPFNPFGEGSASQDAWDYVLGRQVQVQQLKQHVAEATIGGPAFDNWAGAVQVVGGASYRKDSLSQYGEPEDLWSARVTVPDPVEVGYRADSVPPLWRRPDAALLGQGTIPEINGSAYVWELFGESIVPLVGETRFSRSLDLNLAARYAYYEGSGGIWAWKGGLDWRMTDDLRFRTTVSRDIRAANLSERFDVRPSGSTVTDPFLPGEPLQPITVQLGGDPSVKPEEADTITFGVVYQPSWLPGLSLSADVYDINVSGAIGTLGAQVIIDQCQAGATALCDRIVREAPTGGAPLGSIVLVNNTVLNISESRTSGVDAEVVYARPISLFGGDERVRMRGIVTYVREQSLTNPGAPKLDLVGQSDQAPDWQALLNVTYSRGPFSITATERFINSGVIDATWIEGIDVDDNSVPARYYTNLRAAYATDTWGGSLELYGNVSNLFDADPPRVGGGNQYSALGRRWVVGVKFDF